ncbi:MAG: undecaprenyl-diphosphate phosphatase [Oleiphilaceae bacterium]|nr:undecaprenyl-diphosphate phosphatase [Oleiphilaceae bacterium]
MSWWEAVILALIQGLTEFLPISSSAHLILPSQLLGWQDQGLAFDVAVHVGTLFAIVLYFRNDIRSLLVAWTTSIIKKQHTDDSRLAWLIILATIPAGLAGVVFGSFIEAHLRSTAVIAATTIVFGVALWWSDRAGSRKKHLQAMNMSGAILIGLAQALALIPGTSRSGITMTAALLLGYTREASARFSFLLSVPLITAAGSLKTAELIETGSDSDWSLIMVGTLVSFGSAYLCITAFLHFLERIGFTPFVIYRLLLGMILLLLLW